MPTSAEDYPPGRSAWRERLYVIIFEADTTAGQAFDVALITAILASVGVVMLESVEAVNSEYGPALRTAEWIFTVLFTIEYAVRLLCARRPGHYATSFFGVVDFLSVVPTYVSILVPSAQFLLVVRLLRVLRVFRVLKLVAYLGEANFLLRALRESRKKIIVFLFAVLTMVTIFGTLIYLVEGPENGFTSIPRAIYWAIVTLTTVGFGDIAPQTTFGQFLASVLMISGFGIIAVPTGIVTSEMMNSGGGDEDGDEDDGQDVQREAHREAERDTGETIDEDDDASAEPDAEGGSDEDTEAGSAGDEKETGGDAETRREASASEDAHDGEDADDGEDAHDGEDADDGGGEGRREEPAEARTGEDDRAEGHAARASAPCPACDLAGHDDDAVFCKRCGTRLAPRERRTHSDAEPAAHA